MSRFTSVLESGHLHYGVTITEEEWKKLSNDARYFRVDQIMYQTPKENDYTVWAMKTHFKDRVVYVLFDTEHACITRFLPAEFFDASV